ncbi:MAG: tryptophan--tRNA ligase [bacterium]|nr:tryptophan--tRNA ligase [bacterium]MDZ4284945.1 tryptophan--tRNA ligase [Patescibacteria group bacterium]
MTADGQKTLLSGVKPTGRPHIGNYFGAMRQFVELSRQHGGGFFMIADYHALTTLYDPRSLAENTIGVALDYLAIGLDPERAVIFKQSDVQAHTELAWIFDCITTMPYLMRAHAFKDAEAKNKEISVGTFNYPMLMAADILLYSPDIVPVGDDQKQHLEIARDTAAKFNGIFGETFKLPEPHILEHVGTVPGLDGRKMSKSYKNTIPLFAEDEEIAQLVMNIVTDSRAKGEPLDPHTDTVFALHSLFANETELARLAERYRSGSIGYRESKELLVERLKTFAAPLREKRRNMASDRARVLDVLEEGARKALARAGATMADVRRKIGVCSYPG